MSQRRLGDTFWLAFAVHDIVSQERADALAVAAYVFEDGTDDPIHAPAVGQYAPGGMPVTGLYRFGVVATVGNGFEYGKSYNVVTIYTAPDGGGMGVEQIQICERFTLDSKLAGDLNDLAQADILSDATPFAGANVDAAISTRAPEAGGNVAAIKGKTDLLPADPASESGALAKDATGAKEATLAGTPAATAALVTTDHGGGAYNTVAPTPADIDVELTAQHGAGSWTTGAGGDPALIADAVWDELLAGHALPGSTGEALAGASAPTASENAIATEALIATHHGTGQYDAVSSTFSADTASTEATKTRRLAQKILKKVK